MAYVKAIAGALAIMATSGMISDFDLTERGREIHVRVWPADAAAGAALHNDVSEVLSRHSRGRTIVVTAVTES